MTEKTEPKKEKDQEVQKKKTPIVPAKKLMLDWQAIGANVESHLSELYQTRGKLTPSSVHGVVSKNVTAIVNKNLNLFAKEPK